MPNSIRTRPELTFVLLASATAAFSMLQSLLSPVLATLEQDLHTTRAAVSWVLIAWLLSAAVATPILGKVGDMIGKSRTLSIALGATIIGSLVAAVAPDIGWVIVGRVIQGLGGAVFPLAFGIIRDEFPDERVPSAVGVISAIIAVGGGIGTTLAGPIVDFLGWRFLFWLPMAVFILIAVIAHFTIPESPHRSGGRINWLAAFLLAGWLVALLLPISQGTQWGWASPTVIGLVALAVLLFALWLVVEFRTTNPFIDMQVMRLTAVWTTNLVAFLLGASMFATYAFLPQLLQIPASTGYGLGASVSQAGLYMLPMLIGMAITGMMSGPLSRSMGFRAQLAWGSGLIALACLGISTIHASLWPIAAWGGVFGIGLGLAYAALTSVIVQSVPAEQTGVATGMNANIRTIGGAIGTAVMTAIVTADRGTDGLPAEHGFTLGFFVFAAIAAIAVIVSLRIPTQRRAATMATA